MNYTPINNLPQELLKKLLSRDFFETEDLAQVVQVCKRWNQTANEELERTVLFVDQSVIGDEENFLQDLSDSGNGKTIQEIVYTNEGSGIHDVPFGNEQYARQLLDMCPNVRIITMREVNQYFFLMSIINFGYPSIQYIHVHWPSCRTSPAVIGMFYYANHEHKQSITRIMVPNFGDDQSIWMVEGNDLVFNDQFREYLREFRSLVSIEVAPPRHLE